MISDKDFLLSQLDAYQAAAETAAAANGKLKAQSAEFDRALRQFCQESGIQPTESNFKLITQVIKALGLVSQKKNPNVEFRPSSAGGAYSARIQVKSGRRYRLGSFNTVAEANAAVGAAERLARLLEETEAPETSQLEQIPESVGLDCCDAPILNTLTGKWETGGKSFTTYVEALGAH